MEYSDIHPNNIINQTEDKVALNFFIQNFGLLNYTTNIVQAQGRALKIEIDEENKKVYLKEWIDI